MGITFCSIVLNEEEYIGANLRQHYDLCDRWVIVEGADRRWPADRATAGGLSVDGTAEVIRGFPDPAGKIEFVQHGWADDKSVLRNRYAERAGDDYVFVIDADEFLTRAAFHATVALLDQLPGPGCVRIPHVHFWKHDRQVITGGYYDVPHHRVYRWQRGSRYGDDHNHPRHPDGPLLHELALLVCRPQFRDTPAGRTHDPPVWFHYGFCKAAGSMSDKSTYYLNRGEGTTRPETTRDRAAWFATEPPPGCRVAGWAGPWPEVFAGAPA